MPWGGGAKMKKIKRDVRGQRVYMNKVLLRERTHSGGSPCPRLQTLGRRLPGSASAVQEGRTFIPKTPHLSSFSTLDGSTRLPSTPGWKGDLEVLGWGAQPGVSPGPSASGLLCSWAWGEKTVVESVNCLWPGGGAHSTALSLSLHSGDNRAPGTRTDPGSRHGRGLRWGDAA